jgi:hypothetical protein
LISNDSELNRKGGLESHFLASVAELRNRRYEEESKSFEVTQYKLRNGSRDEKERK